MWLPAIPCGATDPGALGTPWARDRARILELVAGVQVALEVLEPHAQRVAASLGVHAEEQRLSNVTSTGSRSGTAVPSRRSNA